MKTFNFIIASLRNFKLLIFCRFVVALIAAVDLALRPYILKNLLDKSSTTIPEQAFIKLGPPALLLIFMAVLVRTSYRFHDYTWLKLAPKLKKLISLKLMDKMMQQSHHFYQNQFAGNLSTKIKDVMNGVPVLILIVIDTFFCHAIGLCLALGTLSRVSTQFAITFAIWVTIYCLITTKLSLIGRKYSKHVAEIRSKVMGSIVDIITNMSSVRFFTNKNNEQNILSDVMEEQIKTEQERDWFYLKMGSLENLSFIIYQTICLYLLISGFKQGRVTSGDFILVLSLNSSVANILWSLASEISTFTEKLSDISQSLKTVLTIPEIVDVPEAKELIVTKGEIVFDKIKFHYKNSKPLFENLSLSIRKGEKVGLVGYSGSGKTTLTNLLLRLFEVTQGKISIDNQNIQEVSQESLRYSISMIPQDPSLFHRSLLDNIEYGKPDASWEEVIEASKAAHAHEFIETLPESYHTLVGERGIKLSGGQRQRVAIARAFLKNAPILVLDEATSALDSITEKYIQKSLQKLMIGKTTIIIAHRFSTLMHVDRIIVLDQGKIVQIGNHKELLKKDGLYKKLWSSQTDDFLPV